MKPKITVIGCGYVGLVTGIGLSDLGYEVICTDKNPDKIKKLQSGVIPFFEPGLNQLRTRNILENRLVFSKDIKDSLKKADIVVIAVGTPPLKTGETDLSQIDGAVDSIIESMIQYQVIIMKSTVPPGTNHQLSQFVRSQVSVDFDWISNPEFLREGRAVEDFFSPDRIVIGYETQNGKSAITNLYKNCHWMHTPFLYTDFLSAELIKYASNSFLGIKISFMNQIAQLSEKIGGNIDMIRQGIGLDPRISPHFLNPGPGFGGSCLPKDMMSLIKIGDKYDVDLSMIKEAQTSNECHKMHIVDVVETALDDLEDKNIGILGLTFKANTDDIRESPAIKIIQELMLRQANVKVFDPEGMSNFFLKHPRWNIRYCQKPEDVFSESDFVLLLTEWDMFKYLDFFYLKSLMRGNLILDARNILDRDNLTNCGYQVLSIGNKMLREQGELALHE